MPSLLRKYCLILLLLCTTTSTWGQDVQFPYPSIPDTITAPTARLSYILQNFWHDYHFADTTQVNKTIGEQGISDYINLLNYADSVTADQAVNQFVQRAWSTPWGGKMFGSLLTHYLGDPQSPLRNDKTYAIFLRHIISHSHDKAQQSRMEYMYGEISKNQEGRPAADFSFSIKNGTKGSLYGITSPWTLVCFSDPTCDKCQKIMPQVIAAKALQNDSLKVIIVYPEYDKEMWENMAFTLPERWMNVWSPKISSEQLYYLPALPSLYLLDEKKRVVLKDTTLDKLLEFLKKN